VMLLDVINTAFSDQAYARRQMLKFVQDQYKPGQRMAVYTLTGSLNVLQDFTSDPQILNMALQRFHPEPQQFASAGRAITSVANNPTASSSTAALDASTTPASDSSGAAESVRGGSSPVAQQVSAMEAALRSFEGAQVAYAKEQRTVLTLEALNSLTRILGGLPGRKNVIWVTGDIPISLIPENRNMSEAELGRRPAQPEYTSCRRTFGRQLRRHLPPTACRRYSLHKRASLERSGRRLSRRCAWLVHFHLK
jgi:VWFA-related protein